MIIVKFPISILFPNMLSLLTLLDPRVFDILNFLLKIN